MHQMPWKAYWQEAVRHKLDTCLIILRELKIAFRCAISGEESDDLVMVPRWTINHSETKFVLEGFQLIEAQLRLAQDRLIAPELAVSSWKARAALKVFEAFNK